MSKEKLMGDTTVSRRYSPQQRVEGAWMPSPAPFQDEAQSFAIAESLVDLFLDHTMESIFFQELERKIGISYSNNDAGSAVFNQHWTQLS